MTASVSVTRAAEEHGPADDGGYRRIEQVGEIGEGKLVLQVVGEGFTVQKAVTSMTMSDAR